MDQVSDFSINAPVCSVCAAYLELTGKTQQLNTEREKENLSKLVQILQSTVVFKVSTV